jgi:hypothetical protein
MPFSPAVAVQGNEDQPESRKQQTSGDKTPRSGAVAYGHAHWNSANAAGEALSRIDPSKNRAAVDPRSIKADAVSIHGEICRVASSTSLRSSECTIHPSICTLCQLCWARTPLCQAFTFTQHKMHSPSHLSSSPLYTTRLHLQAFFLFLVDSTFKMSSTDTPQDASVITVKRIRPLEEGKDGDTTPTKANNAVIDGTSNDTAPTAINAVLGTVEQSKTAEELSPAKSINSFASIQQSGPVTPSDESNELADKLKSTSLIPRDDSQSTTASYEKVESSKMLLRSESVSSTASFVQPKSRKMVARTESMSSTNSSSGKTEEPPAKNNLLNLLRANDPAEQKLSLLEVALEGPPLPSPKTPTTGRSSITSSRKSLSGTLSSRFRDRPRSTTSETSFFGGGTNKSVRSFKRLVSGNKQEIPEMPQSMTDPAEIKKSQEHYLRTVTSSLHRANATMFPNHPDTSKNWMHRNLRCTDCTDKGCARCGKACCAYKAACEGIKNHSGDAKKRADGLKEEIEALWPCGREVPTFMKCLECEKVVCPECCGQCSDTICLMVICRDCKKDPWLACEWHAEYV